ncbi:hypothetical protein HF086_003944 [Spodoptera exigua]|uniref:Integrase catalytic domain-containing protein n=1 Tax=Spodoptera exigua TaxID=7107 RepID=A0A922M652_SPOEX|nr:hypothetical protein HF086_003944 [Spodoptera exigua]
MISSTSDEVARNLVQFMSLFGIPKMILTDLGTCFTSKLFRQVTEIFKIKPLFTSPYHPQTNGALERSRATLKEYLKSFVNENENDWHCYFATAILVFNTTPHSTTQFTPHELLYDYKPNLPNSLYDSNNSLASCLLKRLALEFISKVKEASKQNYDASALRCSPKYKVGDMVYLKHHHRLRKALSPIWKGVSKSLKLLENITLLCHHGSTESEILPVIHSPGLYFDPTTNIFFYNDFWKIVTHVDVNSIEPHLNEIDKLIVKSSLLCSKIEPEEYSTCRDIFNSIEVLLETNYVKAHSLSHIISKDTANRFKRALEFGGEILKFFFGTLDAEDARNYDAAIDACEKK